jgi:DNA-binding protein YbaB
MEKTYVAELKITIDEEVLEHKDGLEAIILDSLEEAPYQVDDLKIKEEEMNYEEKWEELKERLENASIEINVMAVENKSASEATRLFGKRTGVAMALEYMRELEALN